MAKRTSDDEGKEAKIVIYSRMDPATVSALDDILKLMKPEPTRAQLIELAVAEYIERHGKGKQKAGG